MTPVNILGIILLFSGHIFWMMNLCENEGGKVKTGLIYFGLFILSIGSCLLVGLTMEQEWDQAISVSFLVTFTQCFVCYLILAIGSLSKKLFLFITYANFFCVSQNLSFLTALLVFGRGNTFSHLAGILFRAFLQFGGLWLYLRFVKDKIREMENTDGKQWVPLCIAGVLFFFPLVSWTALGTNVWSYTAAEIQGFVLLFIGVVGLYIVTFYTVGYMNTISRMSMIRQQSKYLEEQVKNYEASETANSCLRHDMRHHLLSIAAFVQEGDRKAALDYIREYDNKILNLAPVHYTKHPAVNHILSVYAAKFSEKKIPFEIHCRIPESLSFEDTDLISLLGNLLENALHGCEECEGVQKAEIYLSVQNHKLVVVCENTCTGTLVLKEGLPRNRSIGISSMLTVCKKYGGGLEYSADGGICSACAVLKPSEA